MLTPSKKITYALEAVLYIAYNAKAVPVSGQQLAKAQALPARYLEAMMQKLVRAGILKGVRGPTGGYMLARERRRISLADICSVVSEKNALPACHTALGAKVLHSRAETLMTHWHEALGSVTLADLCDRASALKIPVDSATPTDFTI